MSLLLCRQENVRRPYFIENLGIHVYSSQELSYVIFNHPLLVMDKFIDNNLLEFIREELRLEFLALNIERFLKGGGNSDDALIMILNECGYYSSTEVGRFRQLLSNFRSKHPAEYQKAKADELFFIKQYGRAAQIYRELLEIPKEKVAGDVFVGKVWYNLGSCYARVFRMDLAMDAFQKAYLKTSQPQILEQIVILTILQPDLPLEGRFEALIDDELKKRCHAKVEAARAHAREASRVREVEELFEKDLPKRQEGTKQLLGKWKREYRQIQ